MPDDNGTESTEAENDTENESRESTESQADETESGEGGSTDTGTDWEKEAARLRSELTKARKWEKQAKANADAAKRVAEIEEAQKTAEQRAQDAAKKAEERAQAANERVARAEIKAALTGVVDDPDSIIEDLKISKFLGDEGEPDDDAIASLKAKYEAIRPANARTMKPNQAQGVNGSKEHEKPYTKADLAHMTTDEINEARRAGKLDHLLGRRAALSK